MIRYRFSILLILLFIISCKSKEKFDTTENGLEYHFVEESDTARQPQYGDAVVLNMKIVWNDSLIFDTKEIGVDYRIELKKPSEGSIYEGLAMMHLGDSAIFSVDAFDFYQVTADLPVPTCIKKDDKLKFYVRLLDIMTQEDIEKEIARIDRMKLKNEKDLLQDYLYANNISQSPVSSGLYYIEEKEGYGIKPELGDSVTVHYEGKLINNQPFDSSIKRNKPFKFLYGDTTLIKGWTEGIGMMKQGGVAKLIIPSNLAYGKVGAGNLVPPYATVIFEVHLLNVKKNK